MMQHWNRTVTQKKLTKDIMFITTVRTLNQILICEGKKYCINFGEVFSPRGYLSISESTSE